MGCDDLSDKDKRDEDTADQLEKPGLHAVFESALGAQTLVTIVLDGVETVFTMPRTDLGLVGPKRAITLLDAAEEVGIDLPYSCCGGVCATCCARLHRGTVTHIDNHVLDADDLAQGHLLVCQAVPTSDVVEIRYD